MIVYYQDTRHCLPLRATPDQCVRPQAYQKIAEQYLLLLTRMKCNLISKYRSFCVNYSGKAKNRDLRASSRSRCAEMPGETRSEERRVGKECRSRWWR